MTKSLLWIASALIFVAFLASSPFVYAAETLVENLPAIRFSATDHLLFTNAENELNPGAPNPNLFLHEAVVRAEVANVSAQIHFSNRFATNGPTADLPFVLEKKEVTAEWRDWELRAGDAHHELGKGIALSLYRDDIFGINHTLEGASLRYRPEGGEILGFAGRVNPLKNPVALNAVADPLGENTLFLMGTSATLKTSPLAKLGAHYFIALNKPPEELIRHFNRYWNTVGASYSQLEIVPNVDFYAESNLLLPSRLRGRDYFNEEPGVGTYASLVWSPSPWAVKLEVKDYRRYDFPFRRPPTLEENIVESTHNDDTFGTRLELSHRDIINKSQIQVSYLGGYDRVLGVPIHHGVLGGKYHELELSGGYRSLPTHSNLVHGAFKFKLDTFKRQSIELNARKQRANLNLSALPTVEDRNKLDLTYTFSRNWTASVGYEFVPSNPESNQHFANLGTELKWGALVGKAFVGATSGGTLCSGGVCRRVPPFKGAMLETQYTF
ncbi:MAG: hypothetical protein H6617_12355 [Bdellovibrionaceae bacterium]|nr:hypothetical protein [Pseudobdellovibrionaceae bacterium]